MPDAVFACDLTGHVAIVTGANHGIGAATAKALAACGAAVLVTYYRTADPDDLPEAYRVNRALTADAVVAAIHGRGGRTLALEADLSDAGTPPRLFDLAEAELGPVDILVNNATGWLADTFVAGGHHVTGSPSAPLTAATHDRVFGVDARGGALMIAEFARRHIARGGAWGRIIGLTSGDPEGFPTEVSYGAAKAALDNYTMAAAFELASWGITANMVHPPVTDTGWVNDAVREVVRQNPALIHIAMPDEVAGVIVWLASEHARLVTANRVRLR
jgi:3-oxoacyl-[acyl-carrier protein] reductase